VLPQQEKNGARCASVSWSPLPSTDFSFWALLIRRVTIVGMDIRKPGLTLTRMVVAVVGAPVVGVGTWAILTTIPIPDVAHLALAAAAGLCVVLFVQMERRKTREMAAERWEFHNEHKRIEFLRKVDAEYDAALDAPDAEIAHDARPLSPEAQEHDQALVQELPRVAHGEFRDAAREAHERQAVRGVQGAGEGAEVC
jgi:hypothetical protein